MAGKRPAPTHDSVASLATPNERADASALGFDIVDGDGLEYRLDFAPIEFSCGLLMVPHGKTPSNQKHLFQDHADGPLSQLLPEGHEAAGRGAASFVQ
eukprot:SAG31_NODE_27341_length_427_cov_1.256098_1_plen_97_part_10